MLSYSEIQGTVSELMRGIVMAEVPSTVMFPYSPTSAANTGQPSHKKKTPTLSLGLFHISYIL